jgi:hypothetical protein
MSENSKDKYRKERKLRIEEVDAMRKVLMGQGYCVECGHNDPRDLEMHHLGRARNNPDLVVSLCRNCHGRLTRKQDFWPKKSLDRNNPPTIREASTYRGLSELFAELAQKSFQEYGIA